MLQKQDERSKSKLNIKSDEREIREASSAINQKDIFGSFVHSMKLVKIYATNDKQDLQ